MGIVSVHRSGRRAVTRVAAIDCGTNAIRLLIADVEPDGSLIEVDRQMRIVRLGEGVDRTGEFSIAAIRRTVDACEEYRQALEGVSRIRFVATSAARDARNRKEFEAAVERVLGVRPEVISGLEEARLSFFGAMGGLAGVQPGRTLVVDIGGGSTELVLGPEISTSVDIGCVRMTERHLHGDPPTAAEVASAEADIRRALEQAALVVPIRQVDRMVGLAGSVTTVAAMALGLPAYDAAAIHGSRISVEEVDRVCQTLLTMTRAERAALPFMHPGRVDVIAGGALVLRETLHAAGLAEVIASEADLLDGIASELGRQGVRPSADPTLG